MARGVASAPATVRPATEADVSALSELATRSWSEAFGHSVAPENEAAELRETRSEAYFAEALIEKTILVAEADGALVGYVQFGEVGIPEIDARPDDRGLHRVYVDSAVQGRGIGRALIEAALGHPRLAKAQRVYLTVWEKNTAAKRLYERLGFRTVGTTRFTIGSEAVEDLVMVLERS